MTKRDMGGGRVKKFRNDILFAWPQSFADFLVMNSVLDGTTYCGEEKNLNLTIRNYIDKIELP